MIFSEKTKTFTPDSKTELQPSYSKSSYQPQSCHINITQEFVRNAEALGPLGPAESESAFELAPRVMGMYTDVGEILFQNRFSQFLITLILGLDHSFFFKIFFILFSFMAYLRTLNIVPCAIL